MCHLRVLLDGEAVFDGQLDKGCGNQVFDYGMVVEVQEVESAPGQAELTSPSGDSGVGTASGTASEGGAPGGASHMDNVLLHSEDFSDHSGAHGVPPLNLNQSPPSPPARSETRILNHSVDRTIGRPVVETPQRAPVPAQSSKPPERHHSDKPRSRSRSHSRDRKMGEEEDSGILRTPRSPAMRRKKIESQVSQEEDDQGDLGADISLGK